MSAVYEGTIRHRRFAVRSHEFRHPIALSYLDIDDWRLRRGRHLSGDAIRALVAERTSAPAPRGAIRVLTMTSRLAIGFNPVSFYYCFDGEDRLAAAVAEVTSTPWGERHAYVLRRHGEGPVLSAEFEKRLHVSPFMAMAQSYSIRMTAPGPTLSVHIESTEDGRRAFDATLRLQRVPAARLTSPLQVLALIYGHALALKLKGVAVHPHPKAAA
jgi:DUF1365 family protein